MSRHLGSRALALIAGTTLPLAACGNEPSLTLADPVVASSATAVGTTPTIAFDARGHRAVGWVSAPDGGSDGRLYVSIDGLAAGSLQDTLGAIGAHGEAPPKLAYDAQGTLHALYVVGKEIPGRRFPASALRHARSVDGGRTWSMPQNVADAGTFGSYNFHALHAGADGVLYASWLDGREGKSGTWLTRSTDGGATWEPNRKVAVGEACPCCRTAIATAPGGVVYIAWRGVLEGGVRDVIVARSTDGGLTFAEPVRVHADDWVFDACPHAGPSMATDADGRLHVAWWTGKEGAAGVFYARSSDGARTFGDAVPLDVADFSTASHVGLAVEGARVAVTWDDGTAATPSILLRVSRDGGRRFDPAVPLSASGAHASYPVVRWRGDTAAVVWSQRRSAAPAPGHPAGHRGGAPGATGRLPSVGNVEVMLRTATLR